MINHIVCPTCGRMIEAPAEASEIVCPACSARFANPALPGDGRAAPLRVLPIERQVAIDTRVARIMLLLLGIALLAGIVTMTRAAVTGSLAMSLVVVMVALIVRLVMLIRQGSAPKAAPLQGATLAENAPMTDWQSGMPVDYRRPGEGVGSGITGAKVGAFFGGFFAALLVCAGACILLAATAGSSGSNAGKGICLFISVIAVVGVALFGAVAGRRFGWRGIGPGVTVGLVLGMMALGPCALCYMTTMA